jgi:uncharacterized MAPEG superfamily protein
MAYLPSNFSIYALPAYYVLSLVAHSYALHIATNGRPLTWDNRNPRAAGLRARLQAQLPAEAFAAYERAEAASSNCYENMPLFFGAIILGHVAGLERNYLNQVALRYLLVRTVYVVSYVQISKVEWSVVRTGLYFWGVFICFQAIFAAAREMA